MAILRNVKIVRLGLWPVAGAAAALTAALILDGGIATSPGLTTVIGLIVGLSWTLIGLEQWRRHASRRTGPLMVLLGFAWFGSLLQYAGVPALYTAGEFLRVLFLAVLGHLLLAFPTGRLTGRVSIALVVAAYLDTTLVNAASVLFLRPERSGVENLALVEADDGLADGIRNLARAIGVAVILAGLVVLALRWWRATLPWRRAVAPVLWWGAAAAATGALRLLNDAVGRPLGHVELVFFAVLATVPLAVEVGLLRSQLARAAVAELVIELGQTLAPGQLRDALARALHDPSLQVAYWLPEEERYVDVAGRGVSLPLEGETTSAATTFVERDGARVAALMHDPSLLDDEGLVEAVCAAAGLALENERLQAELRAHLEELRASRVRIVEAADAERRRLERDLHDGTQQRLVSVSMALGLAESALATDPQRARTILEETRRNLGAALQDLRDVSQGIHPAILTERGLEPALRELSYTASVPIGLAVSVDGRLPAPVEAAVYYVVAEAVTNVVKHAAASGVSVTVDRLDRSAVVEVVDDGVGGADSGRGTGLRGLSDRVEAFGGVLTVVSAPGTGTRLRAEIPCGS